MLLILALLLWPLDIALRRVSVGRREVADARRWLAGGWRRSVAPRTADVAGMLAARDRAAGSVARAALLRADDPAAGPGAIPATGERPVPQAAAAPTPAAGAPSPSIADPGPLPPATVVPEPAADPDDGDTLARLRDAKRRARER